MPRMDSPRGDFLKWFLKQCARTDLKISDVEEQERYEVSPWNDRIIAHLEHWGLWKKAPKEDD